MQYLKKICTTCLGILSVVLSSICFMNTTPYRYYGGDAFTGIQQATADVANNVNFGFGSVLFIFGIYLIIFTFSTSKVKEVSPENPFSDDVELN